MCNKIESKKVFDHWTTVERWVLVVAEMAKQNGYKFFLFNDIVYVIDGDSFYRTAMTNNDIID